MAKLVAIRQHSSSMRLIALQFLTLAAIGTVAPFINLYLSEAGFSGTAIGTLLSVGSVLALVLTPLLNRLADKLMLHRRLYMSYLFGVTVALTIFATTRIELLLIFAMLLFEVTVSPSMTLGMQLTMTKLGDRAKDLLGQIRSFAALGFASASLLAGQLFTIGGFSLIFWVGAIFSVFSIQMSTIFPPKPKAKPKNDDAPLAKRNPAFYALVASQFFVMMGLRNQFAFIFIFLSQDLNISTADIGLWAALLAGLEIPFFVLMDKIMPKFPARWVYIVGMLGMAVFMFLLGTTQSLFVLFLLFLFRGVIWPSLHLSSFMVVSEASDPRNVATNQAILQVTVPSIAILLTGSGFGWVFDNLGAQAFFALCGIMCVIAAIIVIAAQRWFEQSVTIPQTA